MTTPQQDTVPFARRRRGARRAADGLARDPPLGARGRFGDRAGAALRVPGLCRLPVDRGDDLRAGDPRPQPADRLQRPILAGARRVLRPRRLCRRDPDASIRHCLLLDLAGRRRRLLCCRLSVRVAGAAAAGPLSRARHLCAGGGAAAAPEIPRLSKAGPAACRASSSTSPMCPASCRSTPINGSIISPWRSCWSCSPVPRTW